MTSPDEKPPVFNYILSFVLVGLAWGFTTPFIRRAAQSHNPPAHPVLESPSVQSSWLKSKLYGAFFAVIDLLRNPRYAIPLVLNLTGSVWFFLLIGQAGKFCFVIPLVKSCQGVSIAGSLAYPLTARHSEVSLANDDNLRTEPDCPYCKHVGFSFYRARRLVRRW